MKHEMRLHSVPFDAIKSGSQVIETRIYDDKRRLINIGDQIIFFKRPDENETIVSEVVGLSIYKSFEKLFMAIDRKKFGYKETDTLEYQVACMRKYYSPEEEDKFGVIGIHISLSHS